MVFSSILLNWRDSWDSFLIKRSYFQSTLQKISYFLVSWILSQSSRFSEKPRRNPTCRPAQGTGSGQLALAASVQQKEAAQTLRAARGVEAGTHLPPADHPERQPRAALGSDERETPNSHSSPPPPPPPAAGAAHRK